MSEKLTITSVTLLTFKRDLKGGGADFSSSITQAVRKIMGWTEIPECYSGGSLDGDLAATVITLTPNDEALKRHAIDLDTTKVHKFEVVRLELEGKKGKGFRFELRFHVKFSDVKGCRKLEEYMLTAGKSTMVVSYEKQAVQADLPGTEVAADAQGDLVQ